MERIQASLQEIRGSLPAAKSRTDSFWTRAVLRPLSLPLTWLLVRMGATANGVSYASALLCIVAAFLLSTADSTTAVIGAVLFNLFAVLDCVDGNIARVRKKQNPFGEWADALGGYFAYSAVLFSSGIAAERMMEGEYPTMNFIMIGSIGAIANILMRLVYQNYRNAAGERSGDSDGPGSFQKKVSENLGITGFLMPAVLVGLISGLLPWVVAGYSVFYVLSGILVISRLMFKVSRAS